MNLGTKKLALIAISILFSTIVLLSDEEKKFHNIVIHNEFEDRIVTIELNKLFKIEQGIAKSLPEETNIETLDITIKKKDEPVNILNLIKDLIDFDYNKDEHFKIDLSNNDGDLSRLSIIKRLEDDINKKIKKSNIVIIPRIEGEILIIDVKKKNETMSLEQKAEAIRKMVESMVRFE